MKDTKTYGILSLSPAYYFRDRWPYFFLWLTSAHAMRIIRKYGNKTV